MLIEDKDMTLGFRKPENINEEMMGKLNKYLKNRKCAYFAKLVLIRIYNNKTLEPLENEHYCVIIKPTDKFNFDKDTYNIFEIMRSYLEEDSDFVDFSVLGYLKTIQIYDDNDNGVYIYK